MSEARLILGDCLDILPTLATDSVDIVMTSPPYNTLPTKYAPSGLHGERKKGINHWLAKATNGYQDNRPEEEYQDWLCEVIRECCRVARGLVWVNHKVRYRDGQALHPARFLPFPIYSEVIWNRGGSMALNCRRYAPSHECLLGFGQPHWWNDDLNGRMSVWAINPQQSHDHPCPFPIEMARRPILSSCPPGGTVLDPFMGSGTTAIACIQTGRNFLGVEIDPAYHAIARKRLAEVDGPLFPFEPSLFPDPAEVPS